MLAILEAIGARARYGLIAGCVAALFLPSLAAWLRPFLPALVVMVYMLSMTRIDMRALWADTRRPDAMMRAFAAALAMLTIPALAMYLLLSFLGLDPVYAQMGVWVYVSPPIASSAGLCFMLGLRAPLALRTTVIASLMAPIIGPLLVYLLIGAEVQISPVELGLKTATMIALGAFLAVFLRRLIGAERIAARSKAFDGITAIAMVIFVIPLFDGVGETILARPMLAVGFLLLSAFVIFAPHVVVAVMMRKKGATLDLPRSGAYAVTMGTRSVAIYLAAVPPDPIFTLFVALLQLPMYAQPLVLSRLYASRKAGAEQGSNPEQAKPV